jgi:hypothetical protein
MFTLMPQPSFSELVRLDDLCLLIETLGRQRNDEKQFGHEKS